MIDRLLEERRVSALHALEIIACGKDPMMDQICILASDIFDVPVAAVTLIDEQNQWLKAKCGWDVEQTSRSDAFCSHTILNGDVLVVPDAWEDERFAHSRLVTGEPHVRFYAGAPLEFEPGIRLGALCLLDFKPRTFSAHEQRRLAQLALLVVAQIRLHGANLGLVRNAHLIALRQADLEWTATHDALTGLPNRVLFLTKLDEAVCLTKLDGLKTGLLIIDIDEFKQINDAVGHDAGDAILKEVAVRLSTLVGPGECLARIGGDEFAILVPRIRDAAHFQEMSSRANDTLREPLVYGGQSFPCFASIGQTIFPEHGLTSAELMKNADLALQAAKVQGRNRSVMYQPGLRRQFEARITVLDRTRDALRRNAVVPYYQPKVSLSSGRIVGFEALLRWRDPILGLQTPTTIWDAFNDPILSVELGRRMRALVLADMAAWMKRGVAFGTVAINVSAAEFVRGDLAKQILDSLEAHQIPPSMLELEVTETVFLGDASGEIGDALDHLSSKGVSIALDDFGTGYASLTHLRQFPVQWLKIDRSFIGDIAEGRINRDAAAIVHTVISLAQSLGIGIVAEGVETREQLEFLRLRRCDLGQGYLFSKAMPAGVVETFLDEWKDAAGNSAPSHSNNDVKQEI